MNLEFLQPNENNNFPTDRTPATLVRLNEKFKLFDPSRTVRRFDELSNVVTYESRVTLDLEDYPTFPVEIKAIPIKARNFAGDKQELTKRQVITPFHPENGYQVSAEDFQPDSRREKFARLRKESRARNGEGDFDFLQTDPLAILLDTNYWDFDKSVMRNSNYFKERFLNYLKKVRFTVMLPEAHYMYVSQGMERQLRMGGLYFHEYMPIDAAHLSYINSSIREGFCLFIPTGVDSVVKMDGEFSGV